MRKRIRVNGVLYEQVSSRRLNESSENYILKHLLKELDSPYFRRIGTVIDEELAEKAAKMVSHDWKGSSYYFIEYRMNQDRSPIWYDDEVTLAVDVYSTLIKHPEDVRVYYVRERNWEYYNDMYRDEGMID